MRIIRNVKPKGLCETCRKDFMDCGENDQVFASETNDEVKGCKGYTQVAYAGIIDCDECGALYVAGQAGGCPYCALMAAQAKVAECEEVKS